MAYDGTVVAAIVSELNSTIKQGRISKIAQPEKDALLLTVKSNAGQFRLFLSASASLPLAYLVDENRPSPATAPNFCMLLRKHIGGGRIVSVTQPGLERIICFEIEHLDEMGDLCKKRLLIELMGKHSNIIFCDDNDRIIDSIKHVSSAVSSVREVLPGRDYFIPETQEKADPLSVGYEDFCKSIFTKPMALSKAFYTSLTGISPLLAEELIYRAGLESDQSANSFEENEQLHLYGVFSRFIEDLKAENFTPSIYLEDDVPVEFAAFDLMQYADLSKESYESISALLAQYYSKKDTVTRIRQKSADLRRVTTTALERNRKKYELQLKQLKDTDKRDKYRIYGELLHTYGYSASPGDKVLRALNYYTNEDIAIPLDPTLTAGENANRYFEKYNKLKRTYEALTELTEETHTEILHLESVLTALDIALKEEDLVQIKEELVQSGYIHRKGPVKKVKITSKPLHFISSDGYHMYVGKNNLQNEELTFKFAGNSDWWFHAKGAPGSHVIVKCEGSMPPDKTFEEAAALAAHYSSLKDSDKVEIDYVKRKEVKKPSGAKPGFVVYYTNFSMSISPDIRNIKELD